MTKAKYLIVLFIATVLIMLLPNISNAATGVEYTRTIPSNEGTIKINFTGLQLDLMQAYEFAIVRYVKENEVPEKWFSIDDAHTETTATITLSSTISEIRDVLKVTDTGFIYIRKQNDTESDYILEAYQVNLKLPYLQSLQYDKQPQGYDMAQEKLYGAIGSNYTSTNTYYQHQKVTDRALIEAFLDIKNNNKDIVDLESSLPEPPTGGYTNAYFWRYKNDGLYLIWVKRTGENCKDVYSCIVHDGLEEATSIEQYLEGIDVEKPTVQSIAVISPASGTYKTGQEVKIKVTFSEEITGETVPVLKIKFGESDERTVANGTISGETIVYSYVIVDGDKGQLAVTGYNGGAIKDISGNEAVIETKLVSGNTIKANIEEPQPEPETQPEPQPNPQPNDTTTAPGKLPQTGLEMGVLFTMIAIAIVGIVIYTRYYKMKDIL